MKAWLITTDNDVEWVEIIWAETRGKACFRSMAFSCGDGIPHGIHASRCPALDGEPREPSDWDYRLAGCWVDCAKCSRMLYPSDAAVRLVSGRAICAPSCEEMTLHDALGDAVGQAAIVSACIANIRGAD